MTPVEIMDKWLDTQNAEFLGELEGADLWAFLEAPIADVVSDSYEYCGFEDYFALHQLVVAEKRREYDAEVDVWLNTHAGVQHIQANRDEWLKAWDDVRPYECYPTDKLLEMLDAIKDL
jgi:hypothetical protein